MTSSPEESWYKRSGVEDLVEFYRTKFVSDEVLDSRYFKALDRFDMRFARTMWVFDNVRPGSTVLDLGCGAGMLALLKRKDVTLAGIDLSSECALASKRNGYDFTFSGDLTNLPFEDHSFDYVVSLDVFGHIEVSQKEHVISEIKRVLQPDGVTLHGIECTDRSLRPPLNEMTTEELHRFIAVDGHVGLEEEQEQAQRFQRFFKNVAFEPRYALCLTSEEFLKQADHYGLPFDTDFLDYLRGLSFEERRAFDIAMGYVFGRISELNIKLPKAGLYVFVKASDSELGPFYNEHRDRSSLLPASHAEQPVSLDRRNDVVFDDGWYEPNLLPPIARWMAQTAKIRFQAAALGSISFDLTTHIPDLQVKPVELEILVNGCSLSAISLYRYGWLNWKIQIPPELSSAGEFEIEVRSNRTWQPRPLGRAEDGRDDRELSIAVCNLEIIS
ncbi:MAG TPA: class I SAM-dependent methyltransferase [Pyrinomonadaceae bacterium]|jgi:ubiquinone/menaquinone biosynthesis C-methylase UbiE|nr:class I SAM-dependent methyltransferase [Pyrinomonadaceae bacterium]